MVSPQHYPSSSWPPWMIPRTYPCYQPKSHVTGKQFPSNMECGKYLLWLRVIASGTEDSLMKSQSLSPFSIDCFRTFTPCRLQCFFSWSCLNCGWVAKGQLRCTFQVKYWGWYVSYWCVSANSAHDWNEQIELCLREGVSDYAAIIYLLLVRLAVSALAEFLSWYKSASPNFCLKCHGSLT